MTTRAFTLFNTQFCVFIRQSVIMRMVPGLEMMEELDTDYQYIGEEWTRELLLKYASFDDVDLCTCQKPYSYHRTGGLHRSLVTLAKGTLCWLQERVKLYSQTTAENQFHTMSLGLLSLSSQFVSNAPKNHVKNRWWWPKVLEVLPDFWLTKF